MTLYETTSKSVQLDFVTIEFIEPDLVIYHYQPRTHITWPKLQEVARAANELTGFKKCYMCSVIGDGVTIEKEARDKGTQPGIHAFTKAAAIVHFTLAHRILANFIVKIQRPPVPVRSFNSVKDAVAWLQKLRIREQ